MSTALPDHLRCIPGLVIGTYWQIVWLKGIWDRVLKVKRSMCRYSIQALMGPAV